MIYITGATGHIGNNFARLLFQHHIPFKAFVRSYSISLEPIKEHIILGDIFDLDFLAKHLKDKDVLFHFAAFIDIQNNNLEESIYVNDFGTKQIIDFCIAKNVRLFYTSSVDVINRNKKDESIFEPIHIENNHKNNYPFTKAKATNYLLDKMKQNLIQATIFYPTAVLGINDFKPSEIGKEILHSKSKKIYFYVNGGYNFIDVLDVCEYFFEAYQKDITGSYILGNTGVKVKALYKMIQRIYNQKGIFIKIPKLLAYWFVKYSKTYSSVMLDAVYDNYHYDLTHTNKVFSHVPRNLEITVSETIKWLIENQKR